MPVSLLGSPARDKRLAGALAEAVKLRLALSGSDRSGSTTIGYRIDDCPGDLYRVSYDINGTPYQLSLSSRPERATDNLRALEEMLSRIAPEAPASNRPATDPVDRPILLSSRDLLTGLAELEGEVGNGNNAALLLRAAYPDSPLPQTAWLWVRAHDSDPKAIQRCRLGVDLSAGDRRLIANYLELTEKDNKAVGFSKILGALERLRTLSNPSFGDTLGLVNALRLTRLRPPALQSLRNIMEIAPYEFRTAHFAHVLNLPTREFNHYVEGMGHLPSILYLRGTQEQRSENLDLAREYFRQAIAANPGDVKRPITNWRRSCWNRMIRSRPLAPGRPI